MKKLYRKGTVHPTPSVVSDHLLSFLPAAILTLTAALSPADREVLAYLISCSSTSFWETNRKSNQRAAAAAACIPKGGEDHPPCFSCSCFRCYMTYWAKWDASPNRQTIHEIIDAFEDSLSKETSRKEKSRREKREKRKSKNVKGNDNIRLVFDEPKTSELSLPKVDSNLHDSNAELVGGAETGGGEEEDCVEVELEKGSVRRFVSFLGDRIWGVWG